jgi:hypothetical protein
MELTPFDMSAVGFKKGNAALPVICRWVKAMGKIYAAKPLGLVSSDRSPRVEARGLVPCLHEQNRLFMAVGGGDRWWSVGQAGLEKALVL